MGTILVIDDEKDLRDIFKMYFAMTFPNVTYMEAGDGDVGLEIAKTEKPDLIIIDYRMPRMDGVTVIKALKRSVLTESIPIILYTGYMAEIEKDDMRYLQHIEVISKPVSMDTWMDKIRPYFR